ncbi:metallophosphoesterase [Candidatus Woesearchaeota archaeon]|nr:metallophosphoesterase [Candidatus Woesearchaeota archaeon]
MLGIISDTHENVFAIKKAIDIFEAMGCDMVIHCGDIISPGTVQFFKGLNIKFVRGNCDGDVEMLNKKIQEINGEFFDDTYEFIYEGKKFIVYHGSDQVKLRKLAESRQYDYVLTGHTHKRADQKVNQTRVINPGALYPTVEEKTVAVLDVKQDKLQFMGVNKPLEKF